MPRTGEPVSTAPGTTQNKVLDFSAQLFAGNVVRTNWLPMGQYRERYYALFVNGVWKGNSWSNATEELESVKPLDFGSTSGSVTVVEVGDHDDFDEDSYVPAGWAQEDDSVDAQRIQITWDVAYEVDGLATGSQLSSIVLTGATRFLNCEQVEDRLQRGKVWYEITTTAGTTRAVRLWANGVLVAEGQRTGNGPVTLTERNSSGLSGSCSLTWTADVARDEDWIDLSWPGSYGIHYSTSPIVAGRTPEAVVTDVGTTTYVYLTPVLAAGSYNYSVQSIGDDGVGESPLPVPADSPKTIGTAPASPTWVGASGNATTGIAVTWTQGEDGCSYTVYRSHKGEPVNLGDYPTPMFWTTPVGSTSTSFVVADYSATDMTATWDAFLVDVRAVVDAVNAAWTAGEAGYLGVVAARKVVFMDLVRALGLDVGVVVGQFLEDSSAAFDQLHATASSIAGNGLAVGDWQLMVSTAHGDWLDSISQLVRGSQGWYAFPGGQLPSAADPTGATATGESEDGSAAMTRLDVSGSMSDLVTPLVRNAVIRLIVRATKGGVQETGDATLAVEIDPATGDVIQPRPNQAWIESWSNDGLDLTVNGSCREDDAEVASACLDLYVVLAAGAIDYDSPQASEAVESRGDGVSTATLEFTVPAGAWYRIAVKARSTDGSRSSDAREMIVRIADSDPASASNVKAIVLRGSPLDRMDGAS